jgi:lipopolysaccharide export LptBFGC system permease protein LptF
LDSIDILGDFMIGGSIIGGFMLRGVMIKDFADKKCEISRNYVRKGHKVLNNRAIEDFIQRETDDNPFDLPRPARA